MNRNYLRVLRSIKTSNSYNNDNLLDIEGVGAGDIQHISEYIQNRNLKSIVKKYKNYIGITRGDHDKTGENIA
jgi:hypothetical protein